MLVRSTKMRHLCFVQLAFVQEKSSWTGKSCVAFGLSLEARETVSFCDKVSLEVNDSLNLTRGYGVSSPHAISPQRKKKEKSMFCLTGISLHFRFSGKYVKFPFVLLSWKREHCIKIYITSSRCNNRTACWVLH